MQNVTNSTMLSLGVTIMVRYYGNQASRLSTTRMTPTTLTLITSSLSRLIGVSMETTMSETRQMHWSSQKPFFITMETIGGYVSPESSPATTSSTVMAMPTTTAALPSPDDFEVSATVVHVLWVTIIVLGALGNSLVMYTMGRHGDRSATNCYILNLAVSDLAVLTIVVPFTINMFTSFDWLYGETLCKANFYLIYVTLQATCMTLTAMTIDRYYAIVHPITSLRDRTPRTAVLISLAIWIASSLLCVPFVVYSRLDYPKGHVYCTTQWPSDTCRKAVTVAFVMSTYVIPLFVIVVCYTLILKHLWRNKLGIRRELPTPPDGGPEAVSVRCPVARRRRKVARMVFTVVLVFAVTWLPIHVFNLCYHLLNSFPKTGTMYNVKIICHTLSYLNSCLNPFIYAFLGDGFQRAFRKSFPRCTFPRCITRNQVMPDPHGNEHGPSTTAETRLAGSARDIGPQHNCHQALPLSPVNAHKASDYQAEKC